jgi:hypothetical protein
MALTGIMTTMAMSYTILEQKFVNYAAVVPKIKEFIIKLFNEEVLLQ